MRKLWFVKIISASGGLTFQPDTRVIDDRVQVLVFSLLSDDLPCVSERIGLGKSGPPTATCCHVVIDHSGEAAKAGIMPRTKLLIFGIPKAATSLMLGAPSIAIDLPLKMLIREDPQGKVLISYNSSQYLQDRHGLPPDLLQNIAVVETLSGHPS